MRSVVKTVALILAVLFPLMLDGRPFRNGLIAIGFASVAIVVDLLPRPGAPSGGRRIRFAAILGGLVAFLVAITLPGSYRVEKAFAARVRTLRLQENHRAAR